MLVIFLDQETTGLDPMQHAVLEIAWKLYDLSTGELKAEYHSILKHSKEVWEKRDRNSIEVNGFTWEKVCQGKELTLVREKIITLYNELGVKRKQAVFICQNPSFDRGFFGQIVDVYTQEKFQWPYHWLDLASMYWAVRTQKAIQEKTPFPAELNLSKDEIATYYGLPKEAQPHKAMNGVDHLILCYQHVFNTSFKH